MEIKLIGSLKVKLINKSPASFPTGEGLEDGAVPGSIRN